MPNEMQKVSGAEEYIAAEIELAEPLHPEQERALRDSLEKFDQRALDSLDIDPQRISICYDPTCTKKKDLLQLITAAGGKLGKTETDKSPLLESNETPL
jgi:hypothetical protein